MKILFVADKEENELWSGWSDRTAEKLADINLIISAGDLTPQYLEFLVTMMNVPLLYVRGNHDSVYDEKPPEGCMDIDDKIVDVSCSGSEAARVQELNLLSYMKGLFDGKTGSAKTGGEASAGKSHEAGGSAQGSGAIESIRIAGLGGSMRYKIGSDMYTEKEMALRVRKIEWKLRLSQPVRKGNLACNVSGPIKNSDQHKLDILITHAPCRGYGDMEDIAHKGFDCFNGFLSRMKPAYHCYGHVHQEYGRFSRTLEHPSGTELLNVGGMYILEI